MRKQLMFLFILLIAAINSLAEFNPRDSLFIDRLTKLATYGRAKLKKQIELNAANNKNNLRQLNNYIIDFDGFDNSSTTSEFNDLTTPLNTGGSYSGMDVLQTSHLNDLNSYLLTANNGINADIYVAVNLRLGLVIETKELTLEELSQIDLKEAQTNKIAKIRVQNHAQILSNHDQIKTYFSQNMSSGISGEFVLFTWGKYYAVREDFDNQNQATIRLSSRGYYTVYCDGAPSISAYYAEKISAYLKEATNFTAQPRKTATELVVKYKTAIDGLKTALANPADIDKLLMEDIIKKYKLEKVGHYVMKTYYSKARGEGALQKLTDLAVYLDKVDTAIFNGYISGVKERDNPDNYWFPINPSTTTEFNKDAIAAFHEHVKRYYDAFLYMKEKANKGVITKAEFWKYFDDHLTWGGAAKKYFIINPLRLLTAHEKLNILKAIEKDLTTTFINRSIADPARDEDLVIALLESTPFEKSKLVLDGLKSTKLLYKIVDKFTMSDFDRIVSGLSLWIFYNYPVADFRTKLTDPKSAELTWTELLEQKRAVHFNDSYFGRRNDEAMDADGNIHLVVRKWFSGVEEFEFNVDPFQYVLVRFENNFEIEGNYFSEGQSYLLPALTVYMLFIEDTREKWFQTGKIVLDVALCALGVGEIRAALQAGKWFRLALATADLGIGLGDIVINTAFRNEIKDAFPDFFETWQKISLCYGLGRLGMVGFEALYRKAYVETTIIKESDEFTEETKELAEQLNNRLRTPDEFGQFSAERNIDIVFPAGHVEVTNIASKLEQKRDHIFTVEWQDDAKTIFKGVHHQSALDAVGAGNYTKNITKPAGPNGVYEAEISVVNPFGVTYPKSGGGGKSTFFPDNWSEQKIVEEVENAVKFNHGRYPHTGSSNMYFGFSKDGTVRIGFYLSQDGRIISYFPIF